MKQLLLATLIALSSSAFAGPHHNGHNTGHWKRGHSGHGWMWVVPAIIGGAIVYQASQPQTTIVVQSTIDPNCSPWTEIQNSDGTITRTRTCQK
jgi:hypothetical protein